MRQAEEQVGLCEEGIRLIEARMMDPDVYSDPEAAARAARDLKDQQAALDHAMRRWEKAEQAWSDFCQSGGGMTPAVCICVVFTSMP